MSYAIVGSAIETELVKQQEVPVTDIQKRADGSFVVTRNGYPFHVTQADTQEVFEQVLAEIKDGAKVSNYIEPEVVMPTPAEAAATEYNRLRTMADFTIAPLQDAVDLGEATEKEVASLRSWKQYRVLLNRVSGQAGYPKTINWPGVPA